MPLDPSWAGLTVGAEVPIVASLAKVLLDDSKLTEKRNEATDASNTAQGLFVAPAILKLQRAVETVRRPEQVTPDGTVPAESFEDALARGALQAEFDEIVRAVRLKSAPIENVRRCRRRGMILAGALGLLGVAVPLAIWGPLWDAKGGPAAAPTVFYIVVGVAAGLATLAAVFYVLARTQLSTSIADAKGSAK